jgi:hypothetical protein
MDYRPGKYFLFFLTLAGYGLEGGRVKEFGPFIICGVSVLVECRFDGAWKSRKSAVLNTGGGVNLHMQAFGGQVACCFFHHRIHAIKKAKNNTPFSK